MATPTPAIPAQSLAQFQKLLQALSIRQRILIASTAVLIGLAVALFAWWRDASDYRPLYTGLAAEDAGAILQKLKEKAVPYRVGQGGGTILVPSAKVAETRLEMAAAGLPKTGRIGFELFDKTHFGATDFMEHVNFRRALEGELERSAMGIAAVEAARVHITFPKESVFAENRLPAKASVMVKLRPGAELSAQNVIAVQYLAASAVEGLAPNQVSVLDMQGNLLGRPKEKGAVDGPEPSEAVIEFQQSVEKNLLHKIDAELNPLLGPEKFHASVVAECDFSSGEQSEESYDPARSVMTSEQETKETTTVANSTGVPGTESNLPRTVPRPGANTGVARENRTIAYATTRFVKHMRLPQGTIKRLSASVLVDQRIQWEGSPAEPRRRLVPPDADQMKRITDVVAAAIGLQPERGDRLVVETLPFENTLSEEPPPAPALPQPPLWQKLISDKSVLTPIAICFVGILLAFVLFRRAPHSRPEAVPAVTPTSALAIAAPSETPAPTLAPAPTTATRQLEVSVERELKQREQEGSAQKKAAAIATEFEKLYTELSDLSSKDPKLCANVLRTWLTETSGRP